MSFMEPLTVKTVIELIAKYKAITLITVITQIKLIVNYEAITLITVITLIN